MNGCHRPVAGVRHVMVLCRHHTGGAVREDLFAYRETIEAALSRSGTTRRASSSLTSRSDHSDSSYCGWVELEEERFFVVNYINDNAPMAQIAGVILHRRRVLSDEISVSETIRGLFS